MHATTSAVLPLVLVVDDEPHFRQLAEAKLSHRCRVLVCSGGASAIEVLGSLVPDAIVLDLQMPLVSGWDVWDWLQASPAHARTPVIFWTSSGLTQGAISSATIVEKGELSKLQHAVDDALRARQRG